MLNPTVILAEAYGGNFLAQSKHSARGLASAGAAAARPGRGSAAGAVAKAAARPPFPATPPPLPGQGLNRIFFSLPHGSTRAARGDAGPLGLPPKRNSRPSKSCSPPALAPAPAGPRLTDHGQRHGRREHQKAPGRFGTDGT